MHAEHCQHSQIDRFDYEITANKRSLFLFGYFSFCQSQWARAHSLPKHMFGRKCVFFFNSQNQTEQLQCSAGWQLEMNFLKLIRRKTSIYFPYVLLDFPLKKIKTKNKTTTNYGHKTLLQQTNKATINKMTKIRITKCSSSYECTVIVSKLRVIKS